MNVDSKKMNGSGKGALALLGSVTQHEGLQNFSSGDTWLGSGSEIPRADINSFANLNEDVLHLIFEHFNLQPGLPTTVQTRKDLLSAAKVCKAFAKPALNSLWRVLPSLLPLLLLLPSAEIVNNQYFVDNLPFTNWDRFEIHARRVRTLYMEPSRVVIPPILYLRIRNMCDIPLLPCLKAIYIPDHNPIDFPSIMFLVSGASLNVVELNNIAISERNFFIPFLSLLASKSSQSRICQLALRGSGNVSLEPVYHLTGLQRLEIKLPDTYLYPKTLRRLEKLVDLVDLTLDVGASVPGPVIDAQQPDLISPNLASLRKLHIIGIPSSITRILDDINLASLTTLVIDEMPDKSRNHTKSFWMRCFDQVSMCQTIEDIEINQLPDRSWGHDNYSLSTSWFLSLSNSLKSLVITGSALSGSDEDFRQLACSFPKLEKLVIPAEYYSEGRTLASLFYFSQYCPHLYEIKICLGFDILKNLDWAKKVQHSIPVNHWHPLQKLYINSKFGQIQPIHTFQVAQFLDLLFPNLSILETYNSNSTESSSWAVIQEIRVAIKANRIKAFQRAMSLMESEMAGMESES